MNKQSLVLSSIISASLTVIFISILTIAGELYKVVDASGKTINPLKAMLASLHGHHWVGKGIWAVAFFALITAVGYWTRRKSTDELHLGCYVRALSITLMCATLIIFGFFIYEYVIHH